MGGSSVSPKELHGKYRPSKAVREAERATALHAASVERQLFATTWQEFQGRADRPLIDFGMAQLVRLEHALSRAQGVEPARTLVTLLKTTLNREGYSPAVHNHLVVLESSLKALRTQSAHSAWRCPACWSLPYKLVQELTEGRPTGYQLRQCLNCSHQERLPLKADDPPMYNWRTVTTRMGMQGAIDELMVRQRLEGISAHLRQHFQAKAHALGVYVPPHGHQNQTVTLRYSPSLFLLYGFQIPNSTREELTIEESPALVKRYHELLRLYHPDTSSAHPILQQTYFRLVRESYEIFKRRREAMHRYLAGGPPQSVIVVQEHPLYVSRRLEDLLWVERQDSGKQVEDQRR